MKNQRTLLLTLLFSFSLAAQKESKEIQQLTYELDQRIPKLLNDFLVPGAAIALIENGEIILQKGYGYSNMDQGTPVTATTGFNIGSISKTFAAWGVMKLVQEGKIDLDAAAIANLSLTFHGEHREFDFDHGSPPKLLDSLVQKIISLSETTE